MRTLFRFLICSAVCALAGSAGATKINIFDPPSSPTTYPITSSPFLIGGATPFTPCGTELPDPNLVEDGCFGGINLTSGSWSAIELVVPNFGNSFSCNTDDTPDQIFSNASCTYDATSNSYDLMFSGGILADRETFYITEDDVPLGDFPDTIAVVTFASTAATPEPASLLLLSTGLLGAGGLVSSRRRRDG